MPLLKAGRGAACGELRCGDCVQCEARRGLTNEDLEAVGFYRKVSDQYINHAPMGVPDGAAPWLTLRIEAIHTALQVYGYDEDDWAWLTDCAMLIHSLVWGIDKLSLRDMRAPEDEALGNGE